MKKQKIILFSNPFGYGPTTTLIHIANELNNKAEVELLVAGKDGGLCQEIFDGNINNSVPWHDVDERDFESVKRFISKYPGCKVISILNRFSVMACKELGVSCALIDFLAWFWEEPADEYSFADIYFTNYLGRKIHKINKNTFDIPIILGPIPERTETDTVLINIGGSQNPLVEGIPFEYLSLFSEIINRLDFGSMKVYIAGGKIATDFVRSKITNADYIVGSMPHEQFLFLHARAKRFISLSGTNATFMSFALGVPTIFLLPQLLAHWKLSLLLKTNNIKDVFIWEDYYPIERNTLHLSEKEIVPLTESFSKRALGNQSLLASIVLRIQNWLERPVDTTKQGEFIDRVGVKGEKVVVSTLIDKWKLIKR